MDEIIDQPEVLNPEESQDTLAPETPDQVVDNEELTKAQELAKNYKVRAEKAERLLKQTKVVKPESSETPKHSDMSLKDIRALQDVPDEDVDEVIDFAKYKGVSVAEAKKSPVMQILLKTKKEERATAEATNTTPARRGSSKASDEDLLGKLSKGELPMEDIERAAKARIERMKKQRQSN